MQNELIIRIWLGKMFQSDGALNLKARLLSSLFVLGTKKNGCWVCLRGYGDVNGIKYCFK